MVSSLLDQVSGAWVVPSFHCLLLSLFSSSSEVALTLQGPLSPWCQGLELESSIHSELEDVVGTNSVPLPRLLAHQSYPRGMAGNKVKSFAPSIHHEASTQDLCVKCTCSPLHPWALKTDPTSKNTMKNMISHIVINIPTRFKVFLKVSKISVDLFQPAHCKLHDSHSTMIVLLWWVYLQIQYVILRKLVFLQ